MRKVVGKDIIVVQEGTWYTGWRNAEERQELRRVHSLQVTFTFTTPKKLDSIHLILHFREHQNVKLEIL